MKNTQLTQEGFRNLEKELEELKQIKRPAAVERLQKARGMGDLSENSEYVAAKESLAFIDERIVEIEEILKSAKIVDDSNHIRAEVELGETVIVENNGQQARFTIVGEYEADPTNGKLSSSSPIGKALLGKKIGNEVEIKVPAGKIVYKIVDIK
ncbi:transcription elongation factor GreA [Candidatus Roizmanbacteria bacterium CG_4_10_14_0_8_um_filter_36_36]|uniref:Transcription elongation factor GreA n=1 Tax=Candidatus Roizmanbacteria bacterium CG_4_8_14_3_um_filter_36_10 TaxID=1974834 RepID=A0A2M8GMJ2_9BACT|nr:MAG: transcription elongation factor GreA [Candidatus Roizmanbacteria bacterium CG_4_10_14_0_8_um_filter_36_36]PJA53362.1 MAG: transcription elongation factor GreA [Candidatus Roizmanbacteria bacterium CG_4_9_14_3_um_filter_36_11]PJC81780.1 MAG: transcription elongation factor GreA [Candidatus Roizmanbacteria bacterium CG_4_8_14_3_um_filter_36_10]